MLSVMAAQNQRYSSLPVIQRSLTLLWLSEKSYYGYIKFAFDMQALKLLILKKRRRNHWCHEELKFKEDFNSVLRTRLGLGKLGF